MAKIETEEMLDDESPAMQRVREHEVMKASILRQAEEHDAREHQRRRRLFSAPEQLPKPR